jgi:hypothetical protein
MREFGFSAEEISQFTGEKFDHQSGLHQERDELMAFMDSFEHENPALAKQLNEEIATPLEKRVSEIEKEFKRLNAQMEQSPDIKTQRELQKFASSITKDKQAMEMLKERSPQIKQQLNELNQQHEKQKERNLERSFSMSLSR